MRRCVISADQRTTEGNDHQRLRSTDRCCGRTLRAARPSAQRATHGDALGRVKYTLAIDGRGVPGDRLMKAWLSALAQSDAKPGTP
jgi:hypothetical protein